jgi:hypothetical protein
MIRPIPGTQVVSGREFLYIESVPGETFHQLVNAISTAYPKLAIPSSGGAIEEKVQLKLKNGTQLIGISYKGDVDGWRTRFIGFCVASGRQYGSIKEGRLVLSDGSSPLLEDLEVSFQK